MSSASGGDGDSRRDARDCGTAATGPGEGDGDDGLTRYEWGGGVVAGLGVFLTPLLTGPVALYCAYKLWDEKRVSALVILAIVVGTVVFWWAVLFSVLA